MAANGPTPKMLEYAKKIAQRLNIELSQEVERDFEACRAFIDEHAAEANRPSEKALNFAKTIAQQKGLQIPEEALQEGRALSRWIDENK